MSTSRVRAPARSALGTAAAVVLALALGAGASRPSAAEDPLGARESLPAAWAGRYTSAASPDSATDSALVLAPRAASTAGADTLERGFDSLDVARARLEEILSRKEFAAARGESAFERWLREAGEAIGRFFRWVFGPLSRVPGVGPWFGWGVLALALAVVIGLLVRATRLEAPLVRTSPREPDTPAGSATWLARAREAAARGEFREAVHHAYWTAAARLAESGLVPFDRARTHRETLRRVPAASAARGPLAELVANYERVWFGRRSAGPEAWADAERRLEELGCSSEATASS